jgi:hypothetical protein
MNRSEDNCIIDGCPSFGCLYFQKFWLVMSSTRSRRFVILHEEILSSSINTRQFQEIWSMLLSTPNKFSILINCRFTDSLLREMSLFIFHTMFSFVCSVLSFVFLLISVLKDMELVCNSFFINLFNEMSCKN